MKWPWKKKEPVKVDVLEEGLQQVIKQEENKVNPDKALSDILSKLNGADGYFIGITIRKDEEDGVIKYTHHIAYHNFIHTDMLSHHGKQIKSLIVKTIEGNSGKTERE